MPRLRQSPRPSSARVVVDLDSEIDFEANLDPLSPSFETHMGSPSAPTHFNPRSEISQDSLDMISHTSSFDALSNTSSPLSSPPTPFPKYFSSSWSTSSAGSAETEEAAFVTRGPLNDGPHHSSLERVPSLETEHPFDKQGEPSPRRAVPTASRILRKSSALPARMANSSLAALKRPVLGWMSK